MSKFYLENEFRTQIDLQDETKFCVAGEMKGLGYEVASDYTIVGDHFIQNYLTPRLTQLELDLNFFAPELFEKIQVVGNFIVTAEKLYLVYQPELSSGIEYRREVEVSSFLKDSAKNGYMTYKLRFNPTSLFYYKKSTRFEVEDLEGEMRYDFTWPAVFNDYAERSISIDGGNHVDVAFDAIINGYTKNPKIEIRKENQNIHVLTFPVEVLENEFVTYSSVDGEIECKITRADGSEESLYHEFDLTTNVFFKVPKDGATVRFSSDTDVMNTIIFTAYFFFKVV